MPHASRVPIQSSTSSQIPSLSASAVQSPPQMPRASSWFPLQSQSPVGDVVTTAFVNRTRTVTDAACIEASDAVVHVVTDAIVVGVGWAISTTDAEGVFLVSVAVHSHPQGCRYSHIRRPHRARCRRRKRPQFPHNHRCRHRCHRCRHLPCSCLHKCQGCLLGFHCSRSLQWGCRRIHIRRSRRDHCKCRMHRGCRYSRLHRHRCRRCLHLLCSLRHILQQHRQTSMMLLWDLYSCRH